MKLTVFYPDAAGEALAVYVAAGLNRAGHQADAALDATITGGITVQGPYVGPEYDEQVPTPAEIIEGRVVTETVARLVCQYQLAADPPVVDFQP